MQCARCAGMKVPEVIVEGGARLFAMRCIHCGDVTDHVILRNRRRGQSVGFGRLRTSIDERYQGMWGRPALIDNAQATLDGLGMLDATLEKAWQTRRG